MFFLLNECIRYSIDSTYLYTKEGHKRKQYQGQKKKLIIICREGNNIKYRFWYSTLPLKQEHIGHMHQVCCKCIESLDLEET